MVETVNTTRELIPVIPDAALPSADLPAADHPVSTLLSSEIAGQELLVTPNDAAHLADGENHPGTADTATDPASLQHSGEVGAIAVGSEVALEMALAVGRLQPIETVFMENFESLVRLAMLLVRDRETARDVVMDSFVAMINAWRRLRNPDRQLAYLRQSVVNRSRSELRRRGVVDRNAPKPAPDMPSAEHGALVNIERALVITGLRNLPDRQREVMVLRYYGDLKEADIAAAMGISRGAVKSHGARAMDSLREDLIAMGFDPSLRTPKRQAGPRKTQVAA